MFLDWVDTLPEQWEAKPLRSVSKYIVSNVDKTISDNEIQVRLCNYTDVYHNEYITLDLNFMHATASEHEIEKFGLSIGDVILTKDSESWDDIGIPTLVRETADDLVCGYHLALLQPHTDVMDGAFLFRCIQAKPIRLQLELSAKGITRFGLPRSEIGAMVLPTPPLLHQRAIADYLDYQTAKLDTLVVAKERMLGLLAERRQALIDVTVSGGIDSTVRAEKPLNSYREREDLYETRANQERDYTFAASGNWVRNASEQGWPTKRLRFLTQQGLSEMRWKVLTDAKQVTFLPMENIGEQGEVDCSIIRDIDDLRNGYTLFFDGDVLVAKITPCFENGKGAIVRGTLSGVGFGTTELHVLSPKGEVDARFLYYVTASHSFRERGEAAMFGAAGQKRVPENFVRDYRVPVPPPAKQHAIADYLDRETARLDELKVKIQGAIALLKERRVALIASAVTGQIAVEDST